VKRALIFVLIAFGSVAYAQRGAAPGQSGQAPAGQAGPGGRGRGLSPEQQAAAAKQQELEDKTPQIPFDAVSLPLQPGPENTIGETVGVAVNSQKHLFVYTRTGNLGPARGAQAAKLFEFAATRGAAGKMRFERGLFFAFQAAQRVEREVFCELFVHTHVISTALRNIISPVRMRVFIVPSGSPVFCEISE